MFLENGYNFFVWTLYQGLIWIYKVKVNQTLADDRTGNLTRHQHHCCNWRKNRIFFVPGTIALIVRKPLIHKGPSSHANKNLLILSDVICCWALDLGDVIFANTTSICKDLKIARNGWTCSLVRTRFSKGLVTGKTELFHFHRLSAADFNKEL